MKVAVVHDYLNQFGGAERCVAAMLEAFPNADLYASFYVPEDTFDAFRRIKVHTSFMQHIPGIRRHYRKYFMVYTKAFEQFDFSGYDVILSSSSAYAKFAIPGSETLHLCYCYTPMRFAWQFDHYVAQENWPIAVSKIVRPFIGRLREYDRESLDRVHHFCAISQYVRRRISDCYGREADIIYPPVDAERFYISENPENYFLVVSRLVAHKRIDIVVKAFNQLGFPLKIVGFGPQLNKLRQHAKGNIEFLQLIDDFTLSELYSKCRALIVPSMEEFGLTSLEAMASGRPVIALRGGGVIETMIPYEPHGGHGEEYYTGMFFDEQTSTSLSEAIARFEKVGFDSESIRSYAMQFDKQLFIEKLRDYVADQWMRFTANSGMLLDPKEKAQHVAQ